MSNCKFITSMKANYLCIFRNKSEMMDQLQDKTDNVAVVMDAQGETLVDYYDVGNRAMYHKAVPDYVSSRNVQVPMMMILNENIFIFFSLSRWSKFHMNLPLAGWAGPALEEIHTTSTTELDTQSPLMTLTKIMMRRFNQEMNLQLMTYSKSNLDLTLIGLVMRL